jgi:Bacterial capsule synthesis protein PGA_cap
VYEFRDESLDVFAVIPGVSESEGRVESYYATLKEKYGTFDTIILITPNSFFDTNAFYESFPEAGKYCYQKGQDLDCISGSSFDSSFYTGVTYGKIFQKKDDIFMVSEPTLGKQFPHIKKYFPETKHIYSLILKVENKESLDYKKMRNAFFDLVFPGKKTLYIASSRGARYAPETLLRYQNKKTFEVLSSKNEPIQSECPNCMLLLADLARKNKKNAFEVAKEVYSSGETASNTTSYFLGEFIKKNTTKQTPSVYGVWFGDTHFTRAFTFSNAKSQAEYLQCFFEKADIARNPKYSLENPLKGFDIVGANLKSSVVSKKECPDIPQSSRFNTDPSSLQMFADVGFNIFNLANNHSYSCGYEWYRATQANLKGLGFAFFGEEKREKSIVHTTQIRGIKVAFIGINDIQGTWDKKEIQTKIEKLKKDDYKVIVTMNWGVEYQKDPSARQREIGYFLVDAGANLVIGSHPHVTQWVETYKDIPIVYSLWNFMFDQPFENTLFWQALVFEITQDDAVNYKLLDFTRNPKTYQIDCSTLK